MTPLAFTEADFTQAHFIIDYDGTLIPLVTTLEEGVLPDSTKALLSALKDRYKIEVSILSGRPLQFLKSQFEGTPTFLAGSHGAEFYNYQTDQTIHLIQDDRSKDIGVHRVFFERLISKHESSFLETKPYGVAIHYGKCASTSINEIEALLLSYLREKAQQLQSQKLIHFKGKNVLEIKYRECNKGHYLETFFNHTGLKKDKIFGFGDDENDENVFREINRFSTGHTFRLGPHEKSIAKHLISDQKQFLSLLNQFLKAH